MIDICATFFVGDVRSIALLIWFLFLDSAADVDASPLGVGDVSSPISVISVSVRHEANPRLPKNSKKMLMQF